MLSAPACRVFPLWASLRKTVANHDSFRKMAYFLQKFIGANNPDAAKLFQDQQILVATHHKLGFALNGTFENHVVIPIPRDTLDASGNIHHSDETQIIRQGFRSLFGGKPEFGFQFLRQLIHEFRARYRRNLSGPRPLDALKWPSPPAGGGKQYIGIKDNRQRHG
jgi:hypothetical protein